jgi:hypothetical protein
MSNAETNKTVEVDAYMAKLEPPFKGEVQAVREILKGVNRQISEQIKCNAPSFSYKGYMATFNSTPSNTCIWCGTTAPFRRSQAGCSKAMIRTGA